MTTGPCGGVNASNSEYQIFGQGERVNIVMQKNLDHFAEATPGNFTVAIRNEKEQRLLGSVPDDKSPSGSLYQIVANIPKEAEGRYVLEVKSSIHSFIYLYHMMMFLRQYITRTTKMHLLNFTNVQMSPWHLRISTLIARNPDCLLCKYTPYYYY